MRAQAPMVGIHFPFLNEMMAATTVNQMNTRAKRYFQNSWPVSMLVKNVLKAAMAVMHSAPPTQMGFETQYRREVTEPTNRPNERRLQTYGPPSWRNEEPSSAMRSAYGMKKNRPIKMSHEKA